MSFWLYAVPLHALESDGWDWAAGVPWSFGLPERLPAPRTLPAAAQIVAAFTSAGCHGDPWFTIESPGASTDLPQCPDPRACVEQGGLDLGALVLTPADRAANQEDLAAGTPITSIGFRKPTPAAVLIGVAALTKVAGPMLVSDGSADQLFAIHEHDQLGNLASHWPWRPDSDGEGE